MGIINKEEALYLVRGIDPAGLKEGKQEVLTLLKSLAGEAGDMDIFSGFSMAAAGAFTLAAEGVGQLSQELDKALERLGDFSPELSVQLEDIGRRIINLTQEIPVKASDCAEALLDIVSAGYQGAEAMNMLERSAREAVMSSGDVAETFGRIQGENNREPVSAAFPEADWPGVIGGIEAQMQLLQNRLLAVLRPLGEQLMKEVSGIAARLGEGLAAGDTGSSFEALNTLATVAAAALRAYKEEVGETMEAITAEGVALQIAGEIRAAYQALLAGGIVDRQEEMQAQAMFRQALTETAATEQQSGDMRRQLQEQLIGGAYKINDIIAAEIVRLYDKKTALNDLLTVQEANLSLERNGLEQAAANRAALEARSSLITGLYESESSRTRAMELQKAVEAEATAMERVGNAEREVRNTRLRIQAVNQQGATAAVMAGTVATRGAVVADNMNTASTTLLARAKQYATIATKSLTAAMAANPIGLVLTVVSMAISAFAAFGQETGKVAGEQERLNKALNEQKDTAHKLTDTLFNQNEADIKRAEALLKLKELYPEVWKDVNLANLSEQERNKLVRQGNELLEERRELELKNAKAASEKNKRNLKEIIGYSQRPGGKAEDNMMAQSYYLKQLRIEEEKYKQITAELERIQSLKKAVTELNMTKEERLSAYTEELNVLKNRLEDINGQLQLKARLQNQSVNPAGDLQNTVLLEEKEEVQGQIGGKERQIEKLQEPTEKVLDERSRMQKKLTDMVTKMTLKRELDSVRGTEKELIRIRQEYDARIGLVDQLEKELQKSYAQYRQEIPADEQGMLTSLRSGYKEEKEGKEEKVKSDQAAGEEKRKEQIRKELADRRKAQTELFLSDEQRKLQAVEDRYTEEFQWIKKMKEERGVFSKDELEVYGRLVEKNKEQEKHQILTDNLKEYQREIDRIKSDLEAKLKAAGGDEELKLKLRLDAENQISGIKAGQIMDSEEWTTLFEEMDTLTVSQIDQLIATLEGKMKEADLTPVNEKALVNNLKKARQKVIEQNPFRSLGTSLRDVFTKGEKSSSDATGQIKNNWKNLSDSAEGCFAFVNDAVGGCEALGDIMGETGRSSLQMLQTVATAGIAMGLAIKTMESSSVILTAISAALSIVNVLVSAFNKDKKKEAKIQGLQIEIEKLERAYDKLGDAIERTYSGKVFSMMDKQNENLREQQELIRQQIQAEGSKKKSDKGKIRDWQNQLEDIDHQIEENQRKRIEMLAGTDVKSAIDEFADALVDAYARGEDGAVALADTTKKVMANAVKEALKRRFLGEQIEEAVNYLGNAMGSGGVLTDGEKAEFQRMVERAGERFSEALKVYDDLFAGEEDKSSGVSGQLQEAMTEGTASQLVGLWNMTANDIRSLRNLTAGQLTVWTAMQLNVGEVLRQQYLIEYNTRLTADYTRGTVEQLKTGFIRMDERLKGIQENTKGYNGRGK